MLTGYPTDEKTPRFAAMKLAALQPASMQRVGVAKSVTQCGDHCHQQHKAHDRLHHAPLSAACGVDSCCDDTSCDDTSCDDTGRDHQTVPPASSLLQSAGFRWHVSGMDCASCARKVETAVRQLAGVRQVQVIFSTQKLLVDADDSLRPRIEQAVQAAGYQLQTEAIPYRHDSGTSLKAFILNKNSALMLLFALLMAASWGITRFAPESGRLAFTLTTLVGLVPVALQALRLLRSGSWFAIESLLTVAALGALFIGASAEAAMVLLLFLIGEQLEAWAANRARRGVRALMALKPETATRLRDGQREQVDPATLQPGDVVEVAAGGRLPADGKLLSACASFDESMLTGEALPVERLAGDKVAAGVTSTDRLVTLQVISKPGDNAIDRIIRLIEEAEERRAPIERFIDRFSRIYTPAIMLLALLVAVVMPLIGYGDWNEWIYKALALLLIGCPCALVISTPAAITSGLAAAARSGALVKGGAALEQLSHVRQLAFDKTGTLTVGQPQVCGVYPAATDSAVADALCQSADAGSLQASRQHFPQDQHHTGDTTNAENALLALASAVEQGSSHPLAQAVVRYAQQRGVQPGEAFGQYTQPGLGIEALVANARVRICAATRLAAPLLTAQWQQCIDACESQGQTVIAVIRNDSLVGLIALRDTLRPEAADTLRALQALQVQGVMLTGDNPRAAAAIATKLHLAWYAGLLPEDKVRRVRELNASLPLAMVGDGINDAPAMKAASLGIAMGSGSDVALETADVALTHNRLNVLPALIALARATRYNVRQNIAIALGLKVIFLITTLAGLSGLWLAVLADTGATVLVTANALRLLRKGNAGGSAINRHPR